MADLQQESRLINTSDVWLNRYMFSNELLIIKDWKLHIGVHFQGAWGAKLTSQTP